MPAAALAKLPLIITGAALFVVVIVWSVFSNQYPTLENNKDFLSSILTGTDPLRTHNEVFSVSTSDKRYFKIEMGHQQTMNPNIIPHPQIDNTWIVVAQLWQESLQFSELACNAVFENDTLKCLSHPNALPIAPTFGDKCTGDLAYLSLNRGPHDARVFYGPRSPYTIFGSNSMFACFGQWIQDFRMLVEWGYEKFDYEDYTQATELQRPGEWGIMEKNWFLFFDQHDQAYLHYDVAPHRVFAKVEASGAVGPDLSIYTAEDDEKCMATYMPRIGPELESIHQATNSLSITLCRRADKNCKPSNSNTYIFTIFQHKTYFNFHALYEPYVMMFEQAAPFKLHAISRRPFWIHGRRGQLGQSESSLSRAMRRDEPFTQEQEMFYVVAMSWKDPSQKYHGYIDDVLFVTFGIEDKESAAIDVTAEALLQDMGIC